MTFTRKLKKNEVKTLDIMRKFVYKAHKYSDSHDFSHILSVCRIAIELGRKIEEEVDPFNVISAALLHDIGKTNNVFAHVHGLLGGALAEEFLDGINVSTKNQDIICRAIVRHTPTSMLPPETALEKLIYDSDTLDRLGLMGLLRGFIGKKGSMDSIMNTYMERRKKDFAKLHFDVSREMGMNLNEELEAYIAIFQNRLNIRLDSIRDVFEDVDIFKD